MSIRPFTRLLASALAIVAVSGCGDSEQTKSVPKKSEPADKVTEELETALGADAGGGELTFDGTTYVIDSATCHLDEPVNVGTVGEGFRVMVRGSAERPDVSILDPKYIQWFTSNDEFTVSDSKITGGPNSYLNNTDDRVVEASFEIECP